LKYHLNK